MGKGLRIGMLIGAAAAAVPASADLITFSGASGNLTASVTFSVDGSGTLELILSNTSSFDVLHPAELLTAVFFSIDGDPTLTPVSALLHGASSVFYDPDGQPAGGVVGGEWAYQTDTGEALGLYGANQGIGSAGFGIFGGQDLFPGPNLSGAPSPNGPNYGLLSVGDNPSTGNGGVFDPGNTKHGAIRDSVILTLSGLPCSTVADCGIGGVTFQYGSGLDEPHFGPREPVPEPSVLLAVATGLTALSWLRRSRR